MAMVSNSDHPFLGSSEMSSNQAMAPGIPSVSADNSRIKKQDQSMVRMWPCVLASFKTF